jgi:hypothetical protein
MPIRNDALYVPSFWAWIACGGFGCQGGLGVGADEPPESSTVCSLFGLDAESVEKWSNSFSGWYPGVFDKSDGCLDDPSTVLVPLANGIELHVQFHPGDWCWSLWSDREPTRLELGNLGGHWCQPGLRWQEAASIAEVGRRTQPALLPLLLPLVWLTHGDDIDDVRPTVECAWSASGFVSDSAANTLAELWCNTAAGGRNYRWWNEESLGWVTDAEWSSRYAKRPADDVKRINRAIAAGISST